MVVIRLIIVALKFNTVEVRIKTNMRYVFGLEGIKNNSKVLLSTLIWKFIYNDVLFLHIYI